MDLFSALSPSAPIASSPHYHPRLRIEPAAESGCLVLGGELMPNRDQDCFALCTHEGIPVPPPSANVHRRPTLPFIADGTGARGGGLAALHGKTQPTVVTVTNTPLTGDTQFHRHSTTHAGVLFAPEGVSSVGDEHSHLSLLNLRQGSPASKSATEVFDAERGRLSLTTNLFSNVDSAYSNGGAGQAIDVARPLTLSVSSADADSSTAGEAAGPSPVVCAVGGDENATRASIASRPSPCWTSDVVSIATPSTATHIPVLATATVLAAPLQFMSPQLMPTNGGGISAVTSPATAPAAPATLTTSDARNDMHPPDALPDAGNDAHEFSLSGRDGTAVSKEGVFNVRGDNDGRSSVPLTGVSDVGVEGTMENEGDSDPTPPMGLIQLNPPLLTEADSETSTAAFNTTKASNFTQQPASSIQLLVSCEEGSVAADVSVSHALQQQNGLSNTNAAALDPESSLQMKEMPKEHQWKPLHTPLHVTVTFDVDERGQSSTSDGAPTPAAMDLSSLLSIVSILSSPELSPSLQFERAPRRVAVSSAGEVEPTPLLGPELNRPGAAKEEKIDNLVSVRSPGLVWGLVGGSSAANCDDLSETAPAAPSTNSSQAARPHSEFPGGRVASADTTEAFFSALRLPNLPKWRRWVSSKYQEVVRQLSGFTNGKWFPQLRPSDLPPKRRGLLKTKSNGGSSSRSVSFPPGDATETVESRSAALGDTHTLKGKIPSLTMALSFSPSRLRSGDEGERSRHFRDYEAPGGLANWRSCGPNNSWFSVVGSTEQRGVVGATGRPMQLRCCITASSSSFIARDAPFPRSSEEWRGDSLTPLSFSLLGESRAGSSGTPEVSRASGGSLQRLFGGLDSTMNNSSNYMNHSGDYYSMSLASLPGHHSLMSRSPANAIADDNYRHMLYHLFHHPPSSRIGDLTACYEAYKAMADTSSNGHHLFNWGELSLLLQPEDYIDYCALFPSHHFITFRDFVELVEVMSVRYHR